MLQQFLPVSWAPLLNEPENNDKLIASSVMAVLIP
jgi:hypothetical protein